jgi:hypothetical protein
MSRILNFLERLRTRPTHSCHRCGSLLMGTRRARYCGNCLWDELEDPICIRNVRGLSLVKRGVKNAA